MIYKKLLVIRKEARKALYFDNRDRLISDKWKLNLLYYFIPFLIAAGLILLRQKLSDSSITYFITGISIFAGLFFNLLIVVSEKMEKRMKQLESSYEPKSNYAEDYKHLSERLIASISYAIILSIILIATMFLSQIGFKDMISLEVFDQIIITSMHSIANNVFSFLTYFLGIKFLILLLYILVHTYDLVIHDMNMQPHEKN